MNENRRWGFLDVCLCCNNLGELYRCFGGYVYLKEIFCVCVWLYLVGYSNQGCCLGAFWRRNGYIFLVEFSVFIIDVEFLDKFRKYVSKLYDV